jgi:signal transduction histidine kinase
MAPFLANRCARCTGLVVPLLGGQELLGALVVLRSAGQAPFGPDEVRHAQALGDLVSSALRRVGLLEQTERERQEAEAAVRTRDEVLAIVSHDLRNPLNTISLAAGALESGDVGAEEVPKTIEVVRRAVDRMNRLISDLLDVARVEAGQKLAIEPAPLEIAAVVGETCDGLAAEAERKGQHLERHVADDLPPVQGDRLRLVQVLANLVGNALKFTGEGGRVAVDARREGADVVVSVADTGPGIPAENLAHVFNAYWQAGQTARLGAGLGLAIAKGIVEAHGGRIWAESTPGQGSTFALALPVATDKAGAPSENAEKDAVAPS